MEYEWEKLTTHGINPATTSAEKKLLGDDKVYIAYDREIISWEEALEVDKSIPGAQSLAEISAVPMIEKLHYELRIDNDGLCNMTIKKKPPSRTDIQALYDINKEGEPIVSHYADGEVKLFDKNGTLISNFEMDLPKFNKIINALIDPCATDKASIFSTHLFTMNGDASSLLLPCVIEKLQKEGAIISYDGNGRMLILRELLVDFLPNSIMPTSYRQSSKKQPFSEMKIVHPVHKMNVDKNFESIHTQQTSPPKKNDLTTEGQQFKEGVYSFQEELGNILKKYESLEQQQLTIIDTTLKKIVATAFVQGGQITGMSYMLYENEKSNDIRRIQNDLYHYNYASGTSSIQSMSSEYTNITKLINLD